MYNPDRLLVYFSTDTFVRNLTLYNIHRNNLCLFILRIKPVIGIERELKRQVGTLSVVYLTKLKRKKLKSRERDHLHDSPSLY